MARSAGALVDRREAVLVLVDMQEKLARAMSEREHVLAAAVRLARAFALVAAPVIVTRQYPQGLGDTEPALEEALVQIAEQGATVIGIDKTAFCCCREAAFLDGLAAYGRSQVVLAGMETHICIAQTALDLASRDYSVQVAADACCSRDGRMHDIALDRLRAAGVVVTASESVMYELVERAATEEFRALLKIVKE
jgi:nicotinamidase-related amidase